MKLSFHLVLAQSLALLLALLSGCSTSADTAPNTVGAFVGRVLTDEGRALPGALVWVPGTGIAASTTPEGHFLLIGLEPGAYALFATAAGYEGTQTDGVIVAGDTVALDDIVLQRLTTSVTGRVALEGTTAYGDTTVALEGMTTTVVTTSSGDFELVGVPQGTHVLIATHEGYEDARVPVVVNGSDPVSEGTLRLLVSRGEFVGVARFDDKEGDDGHQGIMLTLQNRPQEFALTARDGSYSFERLPVGDYTVVATHPDYYQKEPSGGATVTVTREKSASVPLIVLSPNPGKIKGVAHLEGADTHSDITVTIVGTSVDATTAPDGTFELLAVPPGVHRLLATSPGYAPTTSEPIIIKGGATVAAPPFVLPIAKGRIEGRVELQGREDHSDAVVWVGAHDSVRVAPSGDFELSELPVGEYSVVAEAVGYRSSPPTLVTVELEQTTEISLLSLEPNPGSIAGRVRLEDEAELADVRISVPGTGLSVLAEADGSFSVSDVPAGTYQVVAAKPGYVSASSMLVVVPPGHEALVPELRLLIARGTLVGTAKLLGASEHKGIEVRVQGHPERGALVTAEGAYIISGVPVGQYTVVAEAEGYDPSFASDVEVNEDQTTTVPLLELAPNPGSVVGKVTLELGSTGASATVTLHPSGEVTTVSEDGSFEFGSVLAGSYVASVSAPGYRASSFPPFTVAAGEAVSVGSIVLQVARGTLAGVVGLSHVDSDTAHSLAGTEVSVLDVVGGPRFALTNDTGHYTLSNVPVGQYSIRAERWGYHRRDVADVTVSADAVTTVDDVTLDPYPGQIVGAVELELDASPEDALVRVDGLDIEDLAGVDGRFALSGVPAGVHSVSVLSDDYDSAQSDLVEVEPGAEVDVGLLYLRASRGHLSGLAFLYSRESHAGIQVDVVGAGRSAYTGEDGRWLIQDVPVGGYSVRFSAAGFESQIMTDLQVSKHHETVVDDVELRALPGQLTGFAFRADGAAHDGIEVLVNGTDHQGATGADGRWVIGGIEPGFYTLRFEATDHEAAELPSVQVVAGESLDVGQVVLDPVAGLVQGWLELEGRDTHTGALVTVGGRTTSSGPDGRWQLRLPVGNYSRVDFSSPPYFASVSHDGTFTVTKAGIANIPLARLDAVANDLSGSVTVHDHEDASPVTVTIEGTAGLAAGVVATTHPSADGEFGFEALPLGVYTLTLGFEVGWEVWSEDLELTPGPPLRLGPRQLGQRYLRIANDAPWTNSATVTLTLGSSGSTQVCLSNDGPGTCAEPWPSLAASATWMLSPGDGLKQVCAIYRDGFGVASAPICDTISLDTTANATALRIAPLDGVLTRGDLLEVELDTDEPYPGTASFTIDGYASDVSLNDDGLDGDVLAGDGTFSGRLRITDGRDTASEGAPLTASYRDWLGNRSELVGGPIVVASSPLVSDLEVVASPATGTATVTWSSDEPALGVVRWGTTPAYGHEEASGTAYLQQHSATITGLEVGVEYHLRAFATDAAGHVGTSLNRSFYLRPSPPENVLAMGGDGRVDVRWEAPPNRDIAGYRVYEAPTADGPFEVQHADLVGGPALLFSALGTPNDVVSYWTVTAVDSLGHESDFAPVSAATPASASGPTRVCGLLLGVTTWTTADGPIEIDCNLAVGPDATLVIAPGVEVEWTGPYLFRVEGTLAVLGSAAAPVSLHPRTAGDSASLTFVAGARATEGAGGEGGFRRGSLLHRASVDDLVIDLGQARRVVSSSVLSRVQLAGSRVSLADSLVGGGKVVAEDALEVLRSTVSACDALVGGTCEILDSTFEHNTSPLTCGRTSVVRSDFADNINGDALAGALLVEPLECADRWVDPRAWVVESTFVGNRADGIAGAIATKPGCNVEPTLYVTDSAFIDNTCDGSDCVAGAIASALRVAGSSFEGQSCTRGSQPCWAADSGFGTAAIADTIVASSFAEIGRPVNLVGVEATTSTITVAQGQPAATWPISGAVVRGCRFDTGADGEVTLELHEPVRAEEWVGNAFVGVGRVVVSTVFDSLEGDAVMTDDFWGAETTAEMDAAGPDADISTIVDIWEDAVVGRVRYDNWRSSPPPLPQIDSPRMGAVVEVGDVVPLRGRAFDIERNELSDVVLRWSSDRDGPLGTGTALDVGYLSAGTHRITLEAADSTDPGPRSWVELVVSAEASSVALGYFSACAVVGRHLWCWGKNDDGTLGVGRADVFSAPPTRVGAGEWASVAAGHAHFCAIGRGEIWCWGDNSKYQLGDGTRDDRLEPAQVGAADDWEALSAGGSHTCALRNGDLWCWGRVAVALDFAGVPEQVDDGGGWQEVSSGSDHVCGIRNGGEAWCLGRNYQGQLGQGVVGAGGLTPVRVGTAADWQVISAGDRASCGIRAGTLWCWGATAEARLGFATGSSFVAVPTRVGGLQGWSGVDIGTHQTCGVRAGELYCWGAKNWALGAVEGDRITPKQGSSLRGWEGVFIPDGDMVLGCGIRAGQLWCWGELGQASMDLPSDYRLPPVPLRF